MKGSNELARDGQRIDGVLVHHVLLGKAVHPVVESTARCAIERHDKLACSIG